MRNEGKLSHLKHKVEIWSKNTKLFTLTLYDMLNQIFLNSENDILLNSPALLTLNLRWNKWLTSSNITFISATKKNKFSLVLTQLFCLINLLNSQILNVIHNLCTSSVTKSVLLVNLVANDWEAAQCAEVRHKEESFIMKQSFTTRQSSFNTLSEKFDRKMSLWRHLNLASFMTIKMIESDELVKTKN